MIWVSDTLAGPGPQNLQEVPPVSGEEHRVPIAVRPVFGEIAGMAVAFSREHLDDEYADLTVKLVAKLARKRPSPLVRGDRRIWAAASVYVIGRVNFLSDSSQTPHLATERLARLFGVKQTTMSSKGRTIIDLLGLSEFDPEFYRPSRMASHPTAWYVTLNGFPFDARILPPEMQAELARRGLIPGVVVTAEDDGPQPG